MRSAIFFRWRRWWWSFWGCSFRGLFGMLLGWLGWAALIYSYYRIFSRNIPKRAAENRWFLAQRYAVQQRFASARTRFAQRKVYRYFRCPRCRQQLRVPRGRGRISITCPKCGTSFIKKS